MFGSGVLDTVIGLIFVFLLVSLLVTTVNELVSAIILSRAKWLEYGIHRLIGSTWAQELFKHPLVEGSAKVWTPASDLTLRQRLISFLRREKPPSQPSKKTAADPELRWRGSGPSYIPSRTFANVLMELLQGADKVLQQASSTLQKALEVATAGANSVAEIKHAVDDWATQLSKATPPVDKTATQPSPAVPENDTTATENLAQLCSILPEKVKAAIVADLRQLSNILDRNAAGRMSGWLTELEGYTLANNHTALSKVMSDLSELVRDARAGKLDTPQIRQAIIKAISDLPSPAGDTARANLNMVLSRLDTGYTVADAIADVQRFIRSVPAGYVRQLILSLPDENKRMRATLLTLYDDAANDAEKFKQNIEVWFNNAMDRVGGWYKRRAQTVTFGISLTAVVLMNVDAMLIVRYLDAHPGVRDGLVTQAQSYVDAKAKQAAPSTDSVAAGELHTGTLTFTSKVAKGSEVVFSTTAPGAVFRPASVRLDEEKPSIVYTVDTAISDKAHQEKVTAKVDNAEVGTAWLDIQPSYPDQIMRVQKQLADLKLPIGWSHDPNQADKDMRLGLPTLGTNFWNTVWYHLLGWLITAIAATLGAPFWFDMLNKVMSIRSAGKAPEEMPKSPEAVQVPTAPGQSPGEASRLAALAKSGKG